MTTDRMWPMRWMTLSSCWDKRPETHSRRVNSSNQRLAANSWGRALYLPWWASKLGLPVRLREDHQLSNKLLLSVDQSMPLAELIWCPESNSQRWGLNSKAKTRSNSGGQSFASKKSKRLNRVNLKSRKRRKRCWQSKPVKFKTSCHANLKSSRCRDCSSKRKRSKRGFKRSIGLTNWNKSRSNRESQMKSLGIVRQETSLKKTGWESPCKAKWLPTKTIWTPSTVIKSIASWVTNLAALKTKWWRLMPRGNLLKTKSSKSSGKWNLTPIEQFRTWKRKRSAKRLEMNANSSMKSTTSIWRKSIQIIQRLKTKSLWRRKLWQKSRKIFISLTSTILSKISKKWQTKTKSTPSVNLTNCSSQQLGSLTSTIRGRLSSIRNFRSSKESFKPCKMISISARNCLISSLITDRTRQSKIKRLSTSTSQLKRQQRTRVVWL